MAKTGETLTGSISFLAFKWWIDGILVVTLSFYFHGRFSVYSALFIHSPYQTGSQPMSGRYYMFVILNVCTSIYISNLIIYSCSLSSFIAP